jgi:hypothetical protein
MTAFGRTIRLGVVTALTLGSITASVQAFTSGAVLNHLEGVRLKGIIACAECSLSELRAAQPDNHRLVQLTREQEEVVIEVKWVSDTLWWNHLTAPQLRVQSGDGVFERLTAEENLFKEIEITGIPYSSSQTLRISTVTIHG